MATVASLQERIDKSRKARAVERAWSVAKSLEGNRDQIQGLRWIEPQRVQGRGIYRRVDFAEEFPEGVRPFMPVPMNISVVAPATILVPGEGLDFNWTMPLLTRMSEFEGSLDSKVFSAMGFLSAPSVRNRVEAVSFLPFPKVGASHEEQFTPEFMVSIQVDSPLGNPANYFNAVAVYNGTVVNQFVSGVPKHVQVYADPSTHTCFNGQMLITLSAEELAATPENAGELEIYVYRICRGSIPVKKIVLDERTLRELERSITFPGSGGSDFDGID